MDGDFKDLNMLLWGCEMDSEELQGLGATIIPATLYTGFNYFTSSVWLSFVAYRDEWETSYTLRLSALAAST